MYLKLYLVFRVVNWLNVSFSEINRLWNRESWNLLGRFGIIVKI